VQATAPSDDRRKYAEAASCPVRATIRLLGPVTIFPDHVHHDALAYHNSEYMYDPVNI
jgi:hypothetical protein